MPQLSPSLVTRCGESIDLPANVLTPARRRGGGDAVTIPLPLLDEEDEAV